jgi:hypothetical protein
MRRAIFAVLLVLMGVPLVSTAAAAPPDEESAPPGQVVVVAVNARQVAVLGGSRFERMDQLAKALRERPPAFDGGFQGGINAPDVVITEEMSKENFDVFRHLMRQRFETRYLTAGSTDVAGKVLLNPATIGVDGPETVWTDPCSNGPDPETPSPLHYQFLRLHQKATAAPFVVAAIHLYPRYNESPTACRNENVEKMRSELANEVGPIIIGGDFNIRAVKKQHACDPNERSASRKWWKLLTAPASGRVYKDSVFEWHRRRDTSLKDEWTFERANSKARCGPRGTPRRSRIDYLFTSGASIAEAHADVPGWANGKNYKYSDHRFVWGRFVVSGPKRPAPPRTSRAGGADIDIEWDPVPDAAGWVVLRAQGRHPYDVLARLDTPEKTSYTDIFTQGDTRYRYAVAAVGADGGQGFESRATSQVSGTATNNRGL